MKSFVTACALCLGLLLTTAWLIAHPAYAASITVSCTNGSTLTCTGQNCFGADAQGSSNGWCQCSSSNGNSDVKNCNGGVLEQ